MSDEEIRGRNFVLAGLFPSNWKTHWTHNGEGAAVINTDPEYGHYLMMNGKAIVTQAFDTAVFTERQMEGATYRIAFQYENYGDKAGAKVVIKTGTGKEHSIDLSGKTPDRPLADWNPFPSYAMEDVVAADKNITLDLQGPVEKGSSGLRITDIDVQLHLVPLQLKHIQLDDRVYETPTPVKA